MIHLDADTVQRLRKIQRTNKDRKVFIKVIVLLMLHNQCSPELISQSLGIDDSTIYRYSKGYETLGLEGYLSNFYVAYSGQLNKEQEEQIKKEIYHNLYISSKEVAQYIEHTFGIRYSNSAVVKILHRLGFVYKKTKSVPCKANRAAQEAFVSKLKELLA